LLAAQHMAFGYETTVAGYAGAPWMDSRTATTPILAFFRYYHDRYYTHTTNVADVAVLRNWPSMAYSINATYLPATLMEQVLIQYKIPFDLLFDEELTNLDHYGAVILAGQECVSDAQVKLLLDYVQRGGTLVITDNTGEYNDWREMRHKNPFLPARTEGKGRIVYIPVIQPSAASLTKIAQGEDAEPGAASQHTPRLSPAQWVLPINHQKIYSAIINNLPHGLSLTTTAPLTTVAELYVRPETHETLVHFVNFDRKHPLSPFRVTVRKQFPGSIGSVKLFSPDTNDPVSLKFDETNDSLSFTVPSMRVYSMVVIGSESPMASTISPRS
jgi:hypothetical protein